MDLVNNHPLAADVTLAKIEGMDARAGYVVAKATFNFDNEGRVELETEEPYPLYTEQFETTLGLLPRDDLPRDDPAFEVFLLGKAYSPKGHFLPKMRVALSIGEARRELVVFGDRQWVKGVVGWTVTEPVPFAVMPLTYANAYGGSCDVLIDKDSPMMVAEAANRIGKGFDPEPQARAICAMLAAPKEYPLFDDLRMLPNIERPGELISARDDVPTPGYWATVPLDSAIHAQRAVVVPEEVTFGEIVEFTDQVLLQAHPDWVIRPPQPGDVVTLENLSTKGLETFSFPELRIFADYVLGDRNGTRELSPQQLVILPEERRFYVVYRHTFTAEFIPRAERCMRLRLENENGESPCR